MTVRKTDQYITYQEFQTLHQLVSTQEKGKAHLDNQTAKLAKKLFASIKDKTILDNKRNIFNPTTACIKEGDVWPSLINLTSLGERIKSNVVYRDEIAKGGQALEWTAVKEVLSSIKDWLLSLANALGIIEGDSSERTWGISSLNQIAQHFNADDIKRLNEELNEAVSELPRNFQGIMTEEILGLQSAIKLLQKELDTSQETNFTSLKKDCIAALSRVDDLLSETPNDDPFDDKID